MSPRFRHLAIQRFAKVFDLSVVSGSFLAAFALASGSGSWPTFAELLVMRVQLVNFVFIAAYGMLCSITFASCGFYLSHRMSNWPRQMKEIFIGVTFITGVLLVLRWPFELGFATNLFLLVFWFLSFGMLALGRIVGHQLLYRVRAHGRNLRSLVIVGEGLDAQALAKRIEKETSLGYRIVGIIDTKED